MPSDGRRVSRALLGGGRLARIVHRGRGLAARFSLPAVRDRLVDVGRGITGAHRAELQRAVRALAATTEIARAVGGETDLGRILDAIGTRARGLVQARAVIVLLEDHGELEVVVTAGELGREVIGERMPLDSRWGQVIHAGSPERIDHGGTRVGVGLGEIGPQAQTALLVPLIFRGKALGLIAAFDRLSGEAGFDAEDERLLLSFAASAATAVATAQSVAEEQLRHSIRVSERERTRWARELHDDTLQGLGALRVVLSAAARRGSNEDLRSAVGTAIEELGTEISKLRSLIAELRPVSLDELGLAPALETLVGHQTSIGSGEIEAQITLRHGRGSESRLDPEVESTVYRVVQEALSNIAKHARAEHVDVRVVEAGDAIEVLVRDDGVGFDPESSTDGFGLLGIRERVALVDGTLSIVSAPGSGAKLEMRVPIAGRGTGNG